VIAGEVRRVGPGRDVEQVDGGCLANEGVKFGYDGDAERWTVEGADSKVCATVRGWVAGKTGRVFVQAQRRPSRQGASEWGRTRCKCIGVGG